MDTFTAFRAPWVWSGIGFAVMLVIVFAAFAGVDGTLTFDLWKTYVPRELCMESESAVVWLHVVADAAIALAYYSIPIALLYFVRRRTDLTFRWMFVCFALFILACGTTHVMNIVAIWHAVYRFDGLLKLVTGFVSIATAGFLWPLIPKALALPSPAKLRQVNTELGREIEVRRQAEESLRLMQRGLEERVAARTSELSLTNEQLRREVAARIAAEREREELLDRERSARAEAEHANRMKDEFLATLSHELRTPLSAITGWTQLLQEGVTGSDELGEGLAVIDRNAQVQTRLIEELLDMSRISAGKLRMEVQTLNLADVVEAAWETVRPAAEAKRLRLTKAIESDPIVLRGDAGRLQQVVWNLLANAIKFTPRDGEIAVSLGCLPSMAELQVRDNGCGISADFLPHIFDRFRQADSSTTRSHGGLGLGLTIARHLVELHGGSIVAHSPGEGQGTTVIVRLPLPAILPEGEEATAPDRGSVPRPRPLQGLHVLVVDDEPDARQVLRRLLERAGATVRLAGGAAEALDLMAEERPSILISDIGMPGEDGYALLRRVRQLPPEQGGLAPAVALTAFARSEDRVRTLASGFQAYLSKPVTSAELLATLEQLASTAPPSSSDDVSREPS
jgi:signal transduction histidine kinase/CheY-like chemotaxis protein